MEERTGRIFGRIFDVDYRYKRFPPALSQKGTTRLILLLLSSLYFAVQPFPALRCFSLLPFLTLRSFLHVHFQHDCTVNTLQV